jgi:hypothetical protein
MTEGSNITLPVFIHPHYDIHATPMEGRVDACRRMLRRWLAWGRVIGLSGTPESPVTFL